MAHYLVCVQHIVYTNNSDKILLFCSFPQTGLINGFLKLLGIGSEASIQHRHSIIILGICLCRVHGSRYHTHPRANYSTTPTGHPQLPDGLPGGSFVFLRISAHFVLFVLKRTPAHAQCIMIPDTSSITPIPNAAVPYLNRVTLTSLVSCL